MLNMKHIETITEQLSQALPAGVKQTAQGLDDQVKRILRQQLIKLDLVSREEFEIQQQILLKLRYRLDEVQKELELLKKEAHPEKV